MTILNHFGSFGCHFGSFGSFKHVGIFWNRFGNYWGLFGNYWDLFGNVFSGRLPGASRLELLGFMRFYLNSISAAGQLPACGECVVCPPLRVQGERRQKRLMKGSLLASDIGGMKETKGFRPWREAWKRSGFWVRKSSKFGRTDFILGIVAGVVG